MEARTINNDDGHRAALKEIEKLWPAQPGTEDFEKLEQLSILVERYENTRWPEVAMTVTIFTGIAQA